MTGGTFLRTWKNTEENRDTLRPTDITNFQTLHSANLAYDIDFEFSKIPEPESYFSFIAEIIEQETPLTVKDVLKSLNKDSWFRAMDTEIDGLMQAGTWHLVDAKEATNIITGKWVFKIKYKNGKIEKYKARWCARGFSQKHGIDYTETFSGVARSSSVKLLLADANEMSEYIRIVDIKNAFVQTKVKNYDIYMQQPHGYEIMGPNKEKLVCKLDKYLYGLLQASREFNNYLKNILISKFNCKICISDTNIAIREISPRIRISIYVDDMILTCSDEKYLLNFIKDLSKIFPITSEEITQILGIEVDYNHSAGILKLNQTFAIRQALNSFDMINSTSVPTPMEFNWHPDLHEHREAETNDFDIRSALGVLGHIANQTRIDIAFAVARLQREMHKPTYSLVLGIKRIFRYLTGTLNYSLIYSRSNRPITASTILSGFSDASWGGHETNLDTTMKSTSGYIIKYGNTPISWGSQLQRGKPAQSSGESEYIGAYHCATELLSLKETAIEMGITHDGKPLLIYSDSKPCIGMSKNPINHKRNKHIMLKYHWLRISVENDEIIINYLDTKHQPADILTKAPKTHVLFRELANTLIQDVYQPEHEHEHRAQIQKQVQEEDLQEE